jgi:ferredoxin
MIDGKAKLTLEDYCDGLGDCLPACPVDAISFEMREAPAYDEAAVLAAKAEKEKKDKDAELIAEKERLQMEPISKVFGVTSCYYQKLSRSGKCRMTRILKKVGEKSLTELRSLTQEELYAALGNSDELLETLQMCMQACA